MEHLMKGSSVGYGSVAMHAVPEQLHGNGRFYKFGQIDQPMTIVSCMINPPYTCMANDGSIAIATIALLWSVCPPRA